MADEASGVLAVLESYGIWGQVGSWITGTNSPYYL